MGDWLKQQMDQRDTNALSLSYALRTSHVTIGKWLKGTYTPNPKNCRKLARYFGVSEEQVLTIAGHLQPNHALAESRESYTAQPPGLGEAIHLFRTLTDDDQERILAIMRTFVNEQRRAQSKLAESGTPPG